MKFKFFLRWGADPASVNTDVVGTPAPLTKRRS